MKKKTIEINPSIESIYLFMYLVVNLMLGIIGVPTVEMGLSYIILFLYRITRLLHERKELEKKRNNRA
jgi:hypothetical protein